MKFVEYKCKCGIIEKTFPDNKCIPPHWFCKKCCFLAKRIYSPLAFEINGHNYKNGYNATKKLDDNK